MPPVGKNTEASFLRELKKIFGGFTGGLKSGRINGDNVESEAMSFIGRLDFGDRVQSAVGRVTQAIRRQGAEFWKKRVTAAGKNPDMYKKIREEQQGYVGRRINELVAENAQYIQTLPWAWAEHVTEYVKQETLKGRPPKEIEAELRKVMPERIQRNLKTIVRTECSKTHSAITEARAESIGVRAYIWRSAKDERTRYSHANMDGVMVFFDDPPNPEALFPYHGRTPYGHYHAGNTFNCRCYMEPVLNIRDLPDSVRLHYHGKVAYWTKAQIKKRFGKIA